MSAYLKRHCVFEVSIGALREPESYEENIDWINNCDINYGIMCLGMSPNMHHLIESVEYPFELWNNLDKAYGLQEIEDEAWSETNISSCDLSQYFLASTFSHEVDNDEEVSHTVHVTTTLFDSNASFFNQEATIQETCFSVSIEVEYIKSSMWDAGDEK